MGSSHPQGRHPAATNTRRHQIMGLYSTSVTHSQFHWTWGPGVVRWGRVNWGGYKAWSVFKRPAILEQRLHELRQLYQKEDFVICIICKCYRRLEGIKGPVTRGLPEGGVLEKGLRQAFGPFPHTDILTPHPPRGPCEPGTLSPWSPWKHLPVLQDCQRWAPSPSFPHPSPQPVARHPSYEDYSLYQPPHLSNQSEMYWPLSLSLPLSLFLSADTA